MEKTDTRIVEDKIKDFDLKYYDLDILMKNILKIENEIDNKYSSIDKEKKLSKLPPQAIGTTFIYNQLNENYNFFVENQFNKIIRFLEHVENKEKNYLKLYEKCTREYLNNPNDIPFNELLKEKKEIDSSYKLLLILLNEVNGDIVKFNKIYNNLEDSGLFMTHPEKVNQQYLSDISNKLDNVMEGLKVIYKSISDTNEYLHEIERNTNDMSYNLYDISNQLWGISYALYK